MDDLGSTAIPPPILKAQRAAATRGGKSPACSRALPKISPGRSVAPPVGVATDAPAQRGAEPAVPGTASN